MDVERVLWGKLAAAEHLCMPSATISSHAACQELQVVCRADRRTESGGGQPELAHTTAVLCYF